VAKKFFFSLITIAALFFGGCNNSKDRAKEKDNDKIENEDGTDSDMEKAATNYCDCINETFADLNPAIKN
jgi:PBP1b-binding outer membrane lipoprotein LpoB